ncbi:hypothetical protein Tco_0004241 [Tanacetum coccineum]
MTDKGQTIASNADKGKAVVKPSAEATTEPKATKKGSKKKATTASEELPLRIYHKNSGRSEKIFNQKIKKSGFGPNGEGLTPDKEKGGKGGGKRKMGGQRVAIGMGLGTHGDRHFKRMASLRSMRLQRWWKRDCSGSKVMVKKLYGINGFLKKSLFRWRSFESVWKTCEHSPSFCATLRLWSVWERVYRWWKVGDVNAFSIGELFASSGNVDIPNHAIRLWQAVRWTSGYFIWKERNMRVFKGKVSSINKIVQDIQLKSYEWITRRSKKKIEMDWQQWFLDPVHVV